MEQICKKVIVEFLNEDLNFLFIKQINPRISAKVGKYSNISKKLLSNFELSE